MNALIPVFLPNPDRRAQHSLTSERGCFLVGQPLPKTTTRVTVWGGTRRNRRKGQENMENLQKEVAIVTPTPARSKTIPVPGWKYRIGWTYCGYRSFLNVPKQGLFPPPPPLTPNYGRGLFRFPQWQQRDRCSAGEERRYLGIDVGQAVPAKGVKEAAALELPHDEADELRVARGQRSRVGPARPR